MIVNFLPVSIINTNIPQSSSQAVFYDTIYRFCQGLLHEDSACHEKQSPLPPVAIVLADKGYWEMTEGNDA